MQSYLYLVLLPYDHFIYSVVKWCFMCFRYLPKTHKIHTPLTYTYQVCFIFVFVLLVFVFNLLYIKFYYYFIISKVLIQIISLFLLFFLLLLFLLYFLIVHLNQIILNLKEKRKKTNVYIKILFLTDRLYFFFSLHIAIN